MAKGKARDCCLNSVFRLCPGLTNALTNAHLGLSRLGKRTHAPGGNSAPRPGWKLHSHRFCVYSNYSVKKKESQRFNNRT